MSLANTALRTVRPHGVPRRRALVVLLAALALCPALFMALTAVCANDSGGDSRPGNVPFGAQVYQGEAADKAASILSAPSTGAETARAAGVCDECCPTSMFPVCIEVPMGRITIPGLALPAAGVEAFAAAAGLSGLLLWDFCRRRLRFASGAPPLWLLDCVNRT